MSLHSFKWFSYKINMRINLFSLFLSVFYWRELLQEKCFAHLTALHKSSRQHQFNWDFQRKGSNNRGVINFTFLFEMSSSPKWALVIDENSKTSAIVKTKNLSSSNSSIRVISLSSIRAILFSKICNFILLLYCTFCFRQEILVGI